MAENGDLELRNVNAKDTGNYTCVTTYMGPETEEPVETTYEVHLQGRLSIINKVYFIELYIFF